MDDSAFIDTLMAAIQQQVKAETEAEIERQVEACRKHLLSQADSMALKIMRAYQVEFDRDRVLITVKKEDSHA